MNSRGLSWGLSLALLFAVACAENASSTRNDSGTSDVDIDSTINNNNDSGTSTGLPGSLTVGKLGSSGECSHMEITEANAAAGTATAVFDHTDAFGCVAVALDGAGDPVAAWSSQTDNGTTYYWTYHMSGLRVGSLNIKFKYNVPNSNNPPCASPENPEGTALSCDVYVSGP
ncbi:MAG: hypothetical protein IPJ88_17515 [Myxococcales bacterium]|nr:MAG: hypothetical protein IPJ88_17515 [Myxococcales bacterium]